MRFAFLLSVLAAQSFSGLQGDIQDQTGGAIAGATIAAVHKETGQRRSATSSAAGQFSLLNLSLGEWTIRVEAPGFARFQSEEIQISIGQIASRRIVLAPAGLVEKLEVNEVTEGIDAVAPNSSVALGYERIEEAPARSRNYLNFVLAAPNAAPAAGSSSQRTMTGTRSVLPDTGFTFAGIRPRNNSIQIDGMDNRDETTGGNRVAIGLEMIQEFRVAAASIGAELGGAAGGILNVVTRSGVNVWHGDATGFLQNTALNARKPEIEPAFDPGFARYQPGVSGMGPLRKDKSFIAAAYENERERADELSNVPAELGIPGATRELYPTSTRGHEFSSKLDHHSADRSAIMMRYAFSRGRTQNEVQGPDNFAARSAQGSSLTADHSLVGSFLRVLSPSTVADIRGQAAQRRLELTPNGAGPQIDIPGVVSFGTFHRMDSARTERHYQVTGSLSFSRGGHRFHTGADLHRVTLDAMNRDRFHGVEVYPSLASYQARRPALTIQAFGDPRVRMNTLPASAWLHDRWQLAAGLHVEAGLRYEHQRLPASLPESSHNLAPRAGLAWRPWRETPLVLRASAGLFHDRYPLAYLLPAVQNRYERFNGSTVESRYTASPKFPSTYSRKVTGGFEYGLDKDTSITLEASNIRGLRLPRTRNRTGTLPPQFLLEQTALSTYTGMTLTLNRRLSHELAWLVSWTTGRTWDDASDFDEQPFQPFDIRADWAPSRQDQRHRLAASAIFELPFLEGISWAPILTVGGGRPLNALLSSGDGRTGAYPLTARPAGLGRNPFRSQPVVNLDLRVMKTFAVMDGRALLQFGAESFNLLNHTNVERFSPYYAGPAGRLPSYGGILESLPARQVQLLVQFEF